MRSKELLELIGYSEDVFFGKVVLLNEPSFVLGEFCAGAGVFFDLEIELITCFTDNKSIFIEELPQDAFVNYS